MKRDSTYHQPDFDRGDAKAVIEHLSGRQHDVLVTAGPHGVSYSTGDGIEGAILHVYRFPLGLDRPSAIAKGDHDGRQFASVEEATQFALEHGYLKPHVRRVACSKCRTVHGFWCESTDSLRDFPTREETR